MAFGAVSSGWLADVLTCDGDDAKQLSGIKAFIAAHGKNSILYVDLSNAPNTAAIAELCEEAGVYWTSVWHLAKGLDPTTYKYYVAHSTVDGVAQGYNIAKAMFKEFKTPGKDKILALQGQLGNDSAVERYQGLKNALVYIPDDLAFYEKFYFTPGNLKFNPISTSAGNLGVLICLCVRLWNLASA